MARGAKCKSRMRWQSVGFARSTERVVWEPRSSERYSSVATLLRLCAVQAVAPLSTSNIHKRA